MIRAKNWKGNDLKGDWRVSIKIDGVRVIVTEGVATSRTGKPLWNVPYGLRDGDYECYLGTFKDTISRLKTHDHPDGWIDYDQFYSLDPLDKRLDVVCFRNGAGQNQIKSWMELLVERGYEGVVLRQDDKWLKVKPVETYDVKVLGYQPGLGKNEGRLGAVITSMGKVGTGFSDEERDQFTKKYIVGRMIEVKCMHLTAESKFRHPVFVRLREDKES